MNYEQLSLLEIVMELLKEKGEATPIVELIQKALELKKIEDADGRNATRLYMDITTSSDFVFCGEGKWDLKAHQSLDVFDRDGSFFGSGVEEEKDEEDEKEEAASSIADYDIDEEDEDNLDDESYDDEEDEDNYRDEESDHDYDDEYRDSYDDEDEKDYLDEDKYNEYMDDYEDMYDKD